MEPSVKKEEKYQNHEVVFEFEYFINLKLKVKCGFSTALRFKPLIWFQDKKKNYIGISREIWLHLMMYKDYIQIRLDQYEFFDSFNLLNDPPIDDISFGFRQNNDISYLVMKQNNHKIMINCEEWRNITRIGIFLTTFICWNNILQKQIVYFYNNHYIPTCVALNKTYIQVNDIKGFYEKDVEVDLTRLCFELGQKMKKTIEHDIKIYKLNLRIKNKT